MSDNKKRKAEPYFVNGELRFGDREKEVKDDYKEVKESKGKDLLVTLLAFILVLYGVSTLFNKDNKKKEDNKEVELKLEEDRNKTYTKDNLYQIVSLNTLEEKNAYSKEDYMNMGNGISPELLSNNAKLVLGAKQCKLNTYTTLSYIDGKDMDKSIKKILGNINYKKEAFIYGNMYFIYNEELDRYYLEKTTDEKLDYVKYSYKEVLEDNENTYIIKESVLYNDVLNTKSWTLNTTYFTIFISNLNKDDFKDILKGYVYTFTKSNNEYILTNIKIQ